MGSGHAAASDKRYSKVTRVEGDDRDRLVEYFAATPEYKRLARRVHSDGYEVQFREAATVLRTRQEKQAVEIAYVPIKQTKFDEAYLTIGHEVGANEIAVAGIEYVQKEHISSSEDGVTTNRSQTESVEVTSAATLIDATDGKIDQRVYNDPTNKAIDTLSNEVGMSGAYCTACKGAVDGLCYYGCGASGVADDVCSHSSIDLY